MGKARVPSVKLTKCDIWRNCDCAGNTDETLGKGLCDDFDPFVIAVIFKEDLTKWQPKIYNTDFYKLMTERMPFLGHLGARFKVGSDLFMM